MQMVKPLAFFSENVGNYAFRKTERLGSNLVTHLPTFWEADFFFFLEIVINSKNQVDNM